MTSIINTPKVLYLSALALALTFVACGDDKKEKAADTPEEMTVQTESTTPTDNSGDVALNPEHGQPGHRCDIPVGAPLDAPSNQPNIQVQPQSTQTLPVNKDNGSNAGSADVKVNPPHGQPGHRCDIAVGAPL